MKFEKAQPMWIKGQSKEVNVHAVFETKVRRQEGKVYTLNISGATLYRVYINEKFMHYGPARGPHGFARMDCLEITKYLGEEVNSIAIEVAGYNCPTYYTLKEESFLCAEILENEEVIAYTSKDFRGKMQKDRMQC